MPTDVMRNIHLQRQWIWLSLAPKLGGPSAETINTHLGNSGPWLLLLWSTDCIQEVLFLRCWKPRTRSNPVLLPLYLSSRQEKMKHETSVNQAPLPLRKDCTGIQMSWYNSQIPEFTWTAAKEENCSISCREEMKGIWKRRMCYVVWKCCFDSWC